MSLSFENPHTIVGSRFKLWSDNDFLDRWKRAKLSWNGQYRAIFWAAKFLNWLFFDSYSRQSGRQSLLLPQFHSTTILLCLMLCGSVLPMVVDFTATCFNSHDFEFAHWRLFICCFGFNPSLQELFLLWVRSNSSPPPGGALACMFALLDFCVSCVVDLVHCFRIVTLLNLQGFWSLELYMEIHLGNYFF